MEKEWGGVVLSYIHFLAWEPSFVGSQPTQFIFVKPSSEHFRIPLLNLTQICQWVCELNVLIQRFDLSINSKLSFLISI